MKYCIIFDQMSSLSLMKNQLSIALALLIVLSWGCGSPSSNGFEVSGTIKGYSNSAVYLNRVLPTGNKLLDSTQTDAAGKFKLTTPAPNEGIYTLKLASNQSLFLYASPEPVQIEAEVGQFSMAQPTGSKANKVLLEFNKRRSLLRADFVRNMRDLKSLNREMSPESWALKEMMGDKASEAYRDYVMAFADTVPYPEIADYAVYNLSIEGDFYYIQEYIDKQKAKKAPSEYVNYLETKILEHGDYFLRYEAEDFKMANYKGDSISLKSMRGKVVYLFVWSSYCGMSRMENKRLAAWYDAHPDSKVEILSYSIDVDERLWRKAIEEDSLHWPAQMMGAFEWQSPEIQQFGVKNIPVSFLLDAKGIIRTKGIHASELARDYDKIIERWGPK
jgi:hypothetical protein